MNKDQIKELALASGFKLKEQPDGGMDLNPYVYDFAYALQAELVAQVELLQHRVEDLQSANVLAGKTLNRIQAGAGRAGFIAGCELIIDLVSDGSNTGAYKFHAEEYAERVAKGGA